MTSTVTDAELRARNRAVIEAFFDPELQDRQLELFAEDGVKEIPFAPRTIEPRSWHGRRELERNAAENASRFSGIAHVDVRIFPGEDPDELWATSRLAPGATIFGRPYPQDFVHYFRLEDGRIELWREYGGAARCARARGRRGRVVVTDRARRVDFDDRLGLHIRTRTLILR